MSDDVTWVGHSTVLLDLDGFRVITDPLLTRRVAHLRRRRPLPAAPVADVDLVLLSHAHMDHLHLPSLRRLRPSARFVAPLGSGSLMRASGLHDITEVEVGDEITCGPLAIEVVPARHRPGRGPHSRVGASPVGYVVDTGARRYYFAGDTDLFAAMGELASVDVALLPIWGWGPSVGSGHLDPTRAAEATELIRPGLVVPMHWGTYAPEDGRRRLPPWFHHPVDRFADELAAVAESDRLRVLEPGETLTVPPAEEVPKRSHI